MSDHKITIGFNIKDEFGNEYRSESTEDLYDESDLDFIGRQLNTFLSQCGYYRGGTAMLMDSLTDDELWAVEDFLRDYRDSQREKDVEQKKDLCDVGEV